MIYAGPTDMLIDGLELAKTLAPAVTVIKATPATVWYPGQSAEAVTRLLLYMMSFYGVTELIIDPALSH